MAVNQSRFISRVILLFFVYAFVSMFGLITYHYHHQAYILSKSGEVTQGIIIEKHCSDHGRIRYRFIIGNKDFYGSGISCTKALCDHSKVGESVEVKYLIYNPEISECGNLQKMEENFIVRYLLLAGIAIGFTVLIFKKV